ncbi:MAG: immune inhibitor A domain-containing protein, partial [candidate division WOR-3 bacterium]
MADTVRVLCIRVEFVEDTTPLTTGNGKMDTMGFWPDSTGETTLMCDPPHFKRYFERQMEGLRNYFLAMSLGKLYVDYRVVPDDEKSCYQLSRQMQFYGDTTSYEGIEFGLVRLLRDALKAADEDPSIHFGEYDEFIVFHAGSGLQSDYAADGVLDSPYDLLAGEIPVGAIQAYLGEPYILVDSGRTRIEQGTVLPEMMRQDTMTEYGTMNLLGMVGLAGTLCHEFAHLLGAYDLYDVTGVTMGVGGWSLMGYGGWLGDYGVGAPYGTIPGFLDAYHRVALGLVQPLVISLPRDSVPVYAAAVDTSLFGSRGDSIAPTIIKIPISPREYFLIENRQTDVRKRDTIVVDMEDGVMTSVENNEYDFFQPGSGLLIWHVDEGVIADYGPYNAINIEPSHKGVDLEEADGVQDFDVPYYRSYDPFYEVFGYRYDAFSKRGYNDRFTATTNPASDGYTGRSFISVRVLGEADTSCALEDTVIYVSVDWELNQQGFPVRYDGRSVPFLSAFAADLDGDESLEIVTIDTVGRISAWRADGSGYRRGQAVFAETRSTTRSDVAIGAVAGDGRPEVVAAGLDGRVRVFSNNGVLQRTIETSADRIVAAPVLRDLDGDDKCEIVVGSTDRRLYVWHGDGNLLDGFPVTLSSEIRAPVAVTDEPEPRLAVVSADSRLWLIGRDGTVASGFPVQLGNSPFYVVAQPIVLDIDRDGQKELALVAGGEHDFRFYVVGLDGTVEARSQEVIRWPFRGQLAVGDVDRDGYLDVLCASQHCIYAFSRTGALV